MTNRRILHFFASCILTLALIYGVFSEKGLAEFGVLLQRVDRSLLGIYCLLSLAGLLFRTARYSVLLRSMSDQNSAPNTFALLLVTVVRSALVDFLPARLGELSYIYLLQRLGIKFATGLASFGFSLMLDLLVLAAVLLLFFAGQPLLHTLDTLDLSSSTIMFSFALCALIGALLYFCAKRLDRVFAGAARVFIWLKRSAWCLQKDVFQRSLSWLEQMSISISHDLHLVNQRGALPLLLLLTFGLRIAKYAALYVLLIAVLSQWQLGFKEISLFPAIGAFVAAEAAASLPISGLMGFGAYEGAFSLVFTLACQTHCADIPVISVGFAVHLLTQIWGYSLGVLALGIFFMIRKKPEEIGKVDNARNGTAIP